MSNTELGVLGAGRLGDAMTKVWGARTGEAPLVWSRSGRRTAGEADGRGGGGIWVDDWVDVLGARSLLAAIPGRALLDLAEGCERAAAFEGTVISAAASLTLESLQRAFPSATVIRIAPFLIDGANSIPVLALRPHGLPDSAWETATAVLARFGEVDVVRDENLFEHVSLHGASWPLVVLKAVEAAAAVGLDRLQDEEAVGMGRRLFFRAIQAMLTAGPGDAPAGAEAPGGDVATPGGITEQGLKNIGQFTASLEYAFAKMRARADELRA